ncbi:MAG: hypothetical protein R3C11_14610 [Planctomycetaceae bacterium]
MNRKDNSDRVSNRDPKNEADLRQDAKTVLYELRMLASIAKIKQMNFKVPSELLNTLNNALTESFAIHCRAMIHFLFAHNQEISSPTGVIHPFGQLHKNDIIASDFSSSWRTVCDNLKVSDRLVSCIRHSNKEVAHITIDRRGLNLPHSAKTSQWDILELTNEIASLMQEFLNIISINTFDSETLHEARELIAERLTLKKADESSQQNHPRTDANAKLSSHVSLNMTGRTSNS